MPEGSLTPPANRDSSPWRRRRHIALAALVSLALLLWSFRRAEWATILDIGSRLSWTWLALSLIALSGAFLVHCLRWMTLLAGLGYRCSLRRLLPIHYAGLLANLVLPAQFGLDAARVMLGGKLIGSRATMLGVVMADRVVGAWSVSAVALTGALLLEPDERLQWVVPLAAAILLGATLFALLVRYLGGHAAPARLPLIGKSEAWSGALSRWKEASRILAKRGRVMALVALLAAVQILLLGCSVFLLVRALYLPIGLGHTVAAFPMIALLTMIAPFTISGHGLREMLFPLVMGPLGLSENEALALAVGWFWLLVLGSLPGVLSWPALRRVAHDPDSSSG